ncbi:tRNA G18 (ribose-2'-O)-methylase SpoU [Rhizobium tibeticum]|uniref:23S rRNA (Guanosine-2'-O-)-methyltransferase RlmB n=1 Tax=Rhizobium tibeticum TaxID=501024 RepID=A0A1H8J966_9HYPH|nr:RNA methyltransferase [Rhizobium tibeticum]MDP9813186.1 tRNA G18 (ribose-2'-O)-methylase SpoU [Rhizobium tibeticum]SEH75603.1 23S rRNA (guanosine-2'-O-)-methyltransferase RlmB [Rhizobium tibeticum]SEN77334.1 tRNA G18 (ribose-2'-O)-methylase SpoU [Rhizobium tibeticum]
MASRLVAIESADDPRIADFRDIRERDLTGRQNRFIAEGTVVLRMLVEASRGGGFVTEKVLLLRNRVDGVASILERLPDEVPVYVAEAEVLERIVGFHLHRGVLALGRREVAEAELVDRLPERSLVLVGCGISNHDNAGSMFRNAAAFKADAIFLDETSCDPLYRKALRVSVGSVFRVPYERKGTGLDVLTRLAANGFAIWTLSPRGEADIRAIPATERMALVVGTEGEGLPPAVLERFHSARIPQSEGLDSLNVATATGIALFAMSSAAKLI